MLENSKNLKKTLKTLKKKVGSLTAGASAVVNILEAS